MRIIVGERTSGKTRRLIELSAESGAYIVCRSKRHASGIFGYAQSMGLSIPFPLTWSEFLRGIYGHGVKSVLIDNADDMIRHISKTKVDGISFTRWPDLFEDLDGTDVGAQ